MTLATPPTTAIGGVEQLRKFSRAASGLPLDDDHFSFADADTITNDVTIQPGESVVFVNGMTRDQLVAWWGATNLPPNLQIIDFPRIGFSATSDSVYLWNAASATESDYIVGVSIGTAVRGTSFGYDPNVNDADYGFLGYDPDGLSVPVRTARLSRPAAETSARRERF